MDGLVDGSVSAEGSLGSREDGVEVGLLDVGFEAVDVSQRCVGVDGDAVGSKADDVAVDSVDAPELQMAVAFPCVVDIVPVRDLSQQGARVAGEWM